MHSGHGDELSRLYDRLNLTGRVAHVGQHAVSGGCANVWEALLIPQERNDSCCLDDDGVRVAVKVIREVASSASEASLRKRLIREVRAWSCLHHRNVLPLYGFTYGFSPDSRLASLVSPWMPNGTARRYLEKRSAAERIRVLTGVADGLAYLHRHDVVHGDLKGDNIMIDMHYEPRIADFGLSKLLDEVTSTLTISQTGNPFGSVRWTAPELFFTPGVNFESDIWSFGMTVLELFTSAPPYHHLNNDAQVIIRVHNGELPLRPRTSSGMSEALWDLCLDCWNSNPELRPGTRVVAKRLWELDLRYKLLARRKRRASPSPDRRRHALEGQREQREDDEGRIRKSPKLSSTQSEVVSSFFSSLLSTKSGRISAPRTPSSRARSSHSRASSLSSRRSSRCDLVDQVDWGQFLANARSHDYGDMDLTAQSQQPQSSLVSRRSSSSSNFVDQVDPRRFLTNAHSDGDMYSLLHHHPQQQQVQRAHSEPMGLGLVLGEQESEMTSGSFDSFDSDTGSGSSLALMTPRQDFHPSFDPLSNIHGYGYPQYDMQHRQHQPPLLLDSNDDLELLSQSQFLGGFDADAVHPSQWTTCYPPHAHSVLVPSFPVQNGYAYCEGARSFEPQQQSSPFLLPPQPSEAGSYLSGYFPSENAIPSPHALGELFSENFFYEESQSITPRAAPLLLNEPLYNSPLPHHRGLNHLRRQPSTRSIDFESLQRGIISPALSDASEPESSRSPFIGTTPLIDGFGDAFAFESEDEGEDFGEGLALIGGLDISGEFRSRERSPTVHPNQDETPHGSPRQLAFALPLSARNQEDVNSHSPSLGVQQSGQVQVPLTPWLSPLLSSF